MDIRVTERAFTEVPTAEGGVDRRVFGEFESHRGELASYAFGWTTGSDPHVGRLSVGIGAGNPGGGTFHAAIVPHEDTYAFSLVDEPFESVPEGGPHLTADEARAHDTLPFVWWVADTALDRDPRAWWMRHWLLGTAARQTTEVVERREPVLLVVHRSDNEWQLIGSTDVHGNGTIGHLHHAVDDDPSLAEAVRIDPGFRAEREHVGAPWVVTVQRD